MSEFTNALEQFINSKADGEATHKSPIQLIFNQLYIPSKQLLFHLIPSPSRSISPQEQYILQNLSLKAAEQNIQLIHIFEDIWHTHQPIVSSRIAALLGCFTRIHARKTTVKRISKPELDGFLNTNHLNGSPTAKYKYGVFDDNKLVAAASFSAGRPIQRNGVTYRSYELVRFANLTGFVVAGGLGKLLSHFIEEVNPDDIMSYADLDWSTGRSYQLLGFKQYEATPPQAFWLHLQSRQRYYPHKLPSDLVEAFHRQKNSDLALFLEQNGYLRIFNSGNIKYLLIRK